MTSWFYSAPSRWGRIGESRPALLSTVPLDSWVQVSEMKTRAVKLRAGQAMVLACLAGMFHGIPLRGESIPAGPAGSLDSAATLQTAHGLLNRGLWDLAEAEYRSFLAQVGDEHDESAVARYGLAVSLFRAQRWDLAARELARLQEQSPDLYSAEVLTMRAQCALALGQFGAAAKSFEDVAERHADHALADDAMVGAAEARYRAGQFDQALKHAATCIRRWPDGALHDRALWWQGASAAALGDHQAAIEILEPLRARASDSPLAAPAGLTLAQCYHQSGDFPRAEERYRALLDGGEIAFRPAAMLGLGALYLQRGRAGEALAQFDEVLKSHPGASETSTAKLQRAQALYELGRLADARVALEELNQGAHERADEVNYWLAKCRLHEGDPEAAAAILGNAIVQFPHSRYLPEMHYDRAVALARHNEPAAAVEALAVFRARFAAHSLAPDALYLLALCEQRRGQFEQSAVYARQLMADHGDHPLAVAARLVRAESRYQQGDWNGVLTDLRSYLASSPGDREGELNAQYRLGLALYRLDRQAEAETALSEIVRRPDAAQRFGSALLAQADTYFQRSEWEPARELLERYLAGEGERPSAEDALLRLGLCHQRMGRHGEALKRFDELLRRFPQSRLALQVQFERGQALVSLGRAQEARSVLEQVAQSGADSPFGQPAVHHLGAMALREGDFDGAAERFATLEREGNAEIALQFGQSLAAAGKFAEAEEALGRFLAAHETHERAPAAHATLAVALARQQKHAAALTQIARLESGGLSQLDPAMAETVQYEKAWSLRQLGRVEESAAGYRSLLAKGGSTPVIHSATLDLAALEMDAKRFTEAAVWLKKLLGAESNAGESVAPGLREQAWYRLGVSEFERERYADASVAFDRLLGDFPQSSLRASAGYFSGEALIRIGRAEPAAARFQQVVETQADSPECPLAMLRWGECLAAQQHWPKSEQVFGDFISRFDGHPAWYQAQFGIGWAREHQGRHEEAIRAYEAVVARHRGPTAARAQFQIGECHFARKDHDAAVRELLKVDILYAYPEWSAAALFEAGRCFDLMGRALDANAQFEAVVERFGDSTWAQSAAQRLSQRSTAALPGR